MGKKLEGRTALITGAGSGMGAASARLFAEEGCKVILAEINEKNGLSIEKQIRKAGGEALFIPTDIGSEESVDACVQTGIARYGKIDILYNNAAGGVPAAELWTTPLDVWERSLRINLTGCYLLLKAVIPHMIENKYGSIINAGSANAIQAVPNCDVYTAAKGGIVSLSRVLAARLGKYNIRVNCLSPGGCATPMLCGPGGEVPEETKQFFKRVPLKRVGYPEEMANAALFLASEESSYITGVILPVDGGWNAI